MYSSNLTTINLTCSITHTILYNSKGLESCVVQELDCLDIHVVDHPFFVASIQLKVPMNVSVLAVPEYFNDVL